MNTKQKILDISKDVNSLEKCNFLSKKDFILNFTYSCPSIMLDEKQESLEKTNEELKFVSKMSSLNPIDLHNLSYDKEKVPEVSLINDLNNTKDSFCRSNNGLINTTIDLIKETKPNINNYLEKRFDYRNFKESRINDQSNLRMELKDNSSKPKIASNWIKKPKGEENKIKDLKPNKSVVNINNEQEILCGKKETMIYLEEKINKHEVKEGNKKIDNLFKKYQIDSEKKENRKTDLFIIEDPIKHIVESDTNDILSLESSISSKKKNFFKFDENKSKNLTAYGGYLKVMKEKMKTPILEEQSITKTNNVKKTTLNQNYELEYKTFESDNNYDEFYGIKKLEGYSKSRCVKCNIQFRNPENRKICYECEMEKQIENNKLFTNQPLPKPPSTPDVY
jgi:hypothetical protein